MEGLVAGAVKKEDSFSDGQESVKSEDILHLVAVKHLNDEACVVAISTKIEDSVYVLLQVEELQPQYLFMKSSQSRTVLKLSTR